MRRACAKRWGGKRRRPSARCLERGTVRHMAQLRVVVISAGTQVGQNVRATLAGRRDGVALIATSTVSNEPALFDFDAVHLVPPTAAEPAAFEDALLRIMDRERAD